VAAGLFQPDYRQNAGEDLAGGDPVSLLLFVLPEAEFSYRKNFSFRCRVQAVQFGARAKRMDGPQHTGVDEPNTLRLFI